MSTIRASIALPTLLLFYSFHSFIYFSFWFLESRDSRHIASYAGVGSRTGITFLLPSTLLPVSAVTESTCVTVLVGQY